MHASSRCVLHGDGHRDVPPSADMPVRVVSAQTVIVQTNGRMYVTSHGTFEWLIELTDRARTMKKKIVLLYPCTVTTSWKSHTSLPHPVKSQLMVDDHALGDIYAR